MFSRTKLFSASLALGILATAGATGLAQQPQNPSQGQAPGVNGQQRPFGRGEGRGFRHGPGPGGAFGPGVLRELNLTDDQKQQIRAIIEQSFESTKAQHEELRQLGEKRSQGTLSAEDEARARTLHEQMRASMKDTETKIAAILTPEQKAKIEELRKERQANREKFGGRRRGGFPGGPGQNSPPAQKPNP